MHNKLIIAVCTVLIVCGTTARAEHALSVEHWRQAMRVGDIDSELLYAIALKESGTSFNGLRSYGPWPWVMNVNREPRFYSSREAAKVALREELAKGNQQIDVGMWQINIRYNGHYVEDPLELLDPVVNLEVAAKVLRDCGTVYTLTKEILSCYHSGDLDKRGVNYAASVMELADKWGRPFEMRGENTRVRRVTEKKPSNGARAIRIASIENTDDGHKLLMTRLAQSTETPRRVIVLEGQP